MKEILGEFAALVFEPSDSGAVKGRQWGREQPRKGVEAITNAAGQILRTKIVRIGRDSKGQPTFHCGGSSLLAGGVQTLLISLQWQEAHL